MQLPEALKSVLRHPFSGATFTVAAIVIGLMASLYHDQILSAWPFPYFEEGEFHGWGDPVPQAILFWSILGCFAVFLGLREAVRADDSEKIRTRYTQQLKELKLLTETCPPKEFLNRYEDLFNRVVFASEEAISLTSQSSPGESNDADPLTRAIRFVLDAMLQLARRWDSTTDVDQIDARTYRANVMWCYAGESITDKERRQALFELSRKLYIFENETELFEFAEGFLKVDLQLSTKESTNGEADPEIKDLMLIYNRDRRKPTRNLDGAPMAAVEAAMRYVADTNDLATTTDGNHAFSAEELEKIAHYYDGEDKGRSIISLPVPSTLGGRDPSAPIAIVNLYRDHKGIMGSKARAEQFAHLMAPFIATLRQTMFAMK